jgi:hypothetical protein
MVNQWRRIGVIRRFEDSLAVRSLQLELGRDNARAERDEKDERGVARRRGHGAKIVKRNFPITPETLVCESGVLFGGALKF